MALSPQVVEARELIKQTIVATLMREQGMSPEEAEAYANERLAETMPPEGSPMNPMELSTMEVRGTPPGQEPQVSDQAAGAVSPSSPAPAATPETQQASLMDRLGPEGLETLLDQGGIDEQRDQAMYLRNKEGPQGLGGVGRMNTYVAASPLAHLASGVEKHRAKKDIKRLRDEEKEGNRIMLDLLRGKEKELDEPDPDKPGFGLGVI